jgi:hypothetical protein
MINVDRVYDIIDRMFPKNEKIPPLQELDTACRKQGLDIEYIEDDGTVKSGGLAYVYRAFNGAYRIFLNPVATEIERKFMDLHEKGHVVGNHMNVGPNREHFKKAIAAEFHKITQYFADTTLKNKSEDELVDFLYWKFANIAQDMEINSMQFSKDWSGVAKITMARVANEVNLNLAKTGKKQKQIIAGLMREIETGQSQYFCHPENYEGLAYELDWIMYMEYLIQHIEETVQKIAVAAAGGHGKASGKGGINDGDVKEESEQNHGEEPNTDWDEEVEDTEDDFEEGGHGAGPSHNTVVKEAQGVSSMEDLAKIIQKHSYSHEKRYLHTDVLYNSNRAKQNGVVIPRRQFIRKVYPGAMQFLVDVSGSVNIGLVESAIKTISETVSFDKKRSHVVCWDTALCADFTLDEPIKIPRGGDNMCSLGMRYIIQNYIKRPDDKIFWISDYGDYLRKIMNEAKKAHCYKASIGYRYSDEDDPFDNDWDRMSPAERQEYMTVFECFTINGSAWKGSRW